jgi:hypothetical protein
MKPLISSIVAVVFCTTLSLGVPQGRAFTGEIMDSACAAMGSHKQMMKQEGAKNARECTLKCVQMGSKLVLHNSARKTTYQLNDQDKAKDFAGQKVNVTGTYDRASKTIHVEKIGPAS